MSLRAGLGWGALGFVLAALVFKPLGMAVLGMPASAWAFVFVGALSVGVLEEGTRAVLLRTRRPRGVGLAGVALGWALAEGLIVGIGGLVQLLVLQADPGALAQARATWPAPAADAVQRQIDSLSALTAITWPLERCAALVLQIGLTAWLAPAPVRRAPVAMLTHTALDLPAAGFQAGLWPLAPVQALYAALALVCAPAVLRWWREQVRPAPARAATTG